MSTSCEIRTLHVGWRFIWTAHTPLNKLGDPAGVIKHFYKRAIFRQTAETVWKLAPGLQPTKIPAFDLGEPRCSFAVSVAFDYRISQKSEVSVVPTLNNPCNLLGSRGFEWLYESEKSPPDHSGVNDFWRNGHHDPCGRKSKSGAS